MRLIIVTFVIAFPLFASSQVDIDNLKDTNQKLYRQLMMLQLQTEECLRSTYDSGLLGMKQRTGGTRPYMSYPVEQSIPMCNTANRKGHVGLDSMNVLLNGVNFRTGAEGYELKMPSKTYRDFHASQDIPFPEVPKSVIGKKTVTEQVDEMRLYFKAWAEQNTRIRNYKPYFKAVLCYLEGKWLNFENNKYDDEFARGNQHFLGSLYNGFPTDQPYLPTTLLKMGSDNVPVIAKWDYRIMCHPLKDDLPTNKFHLQDNIMSRVTLKQSIEQFEDSNAAKFILNPSLKNAKFKHVHHKYSFLDKLMEEIPGLDNYGANNLDEVFGFQSKHPLTKKDSNAANYVRWYQVSKKGAMGTQSRHKGWNDGTIFMSKTTQKEVATLEAQHKCSEDKKTKKITCQFNEKSKMSFAVPLEIIYLTPLDKWNPYKLPVKPDDFYLTPASLFSVPQEVNPQPCDTASGFKTIGKHKVMAAGVRTFLPPMDLGETRTLRMRFPLLANADAGSAEGKEYEALKVVSLNFKAYSWKMGMKNDILKGKHVQSSTAAIASTVELRMSTAPADFKNNIVLHDHRALIDAARAKEMEQDSSIIERVTSEIASGHTHDMEMYYDKILKKFKYKTCDGKPICPDGHVQALERL